MNNIATVSQEMPKMRRMPQLSKDTKNQRYNRIDDGCIQVYISNSKKVTIGLVYYGSILCLDVRNWLRPLGKTEWFPTSKGTFFDIKTWNEEIFPGISKQLARANDQLSEGHKPDPKTVKEDSK